MRLVSADQESPCTLLQQWVLGLQVRLVFEQLSDIETDAVLGLAPADIAAGELRPTGIAHLTIFSQGSSNLTDCICQQ